MKTVTYGVDGLIDWRAQIPAGKARLSVHFTGGAITKYGVTPAEFTTSDPITQRLIEDSEYYRSRKIRTLRTSGRAEPAAVSRRSDIPTADAYAAATLPLSESAPQEVIKAACLEDAIEVLRQRYQIPSVQLRTRETILQAAAKHNIRFDFNQT